MLLRKGTDSDLPKIISLLRISLGESIIPKSEALWKWKHENNPFGPSPVLVAEVDGEIIGVRAFLQWEFLLSGTLLKACRAVDTAIHPDFQGKGIFTKLTLTLIDQLKQEGFDLIFNTPNAASMPGYLKMGWEKWGKLPLKLDFHLSIGKNKHPIQPESWSKILHLVEQIEHLGDFSGANQTNLKPGYLKWRYLDCPLFPYYYISDYKSFLLFYRIKESKMGRELRITDLFIMEGFEKEQEIHLNKSLSYFQKLSGARFTSFSGLQYPDQKALNLGALPIFNAGPYVTLRKVKQDLDLQNLDWRWSLGDLEVF